MRGWQLAAIGWLGAGLLRIYGRTLRITIEDASGMGGVRPPLPIIGVFWHNRMVMIPVIWSRLCPGLPTSCLTSTSKDGEITARILSRFGFETVRGSTSRRGVAATLGIRRALEGGRAMAIVPDGPRGPCYRFQPGAIRLAMETGTPIVPVTWRAARCWRLKSWDRFMIPKPFSRVEAKLGVPVFLHGDASDAGQVELLRERMEVRLLALAGGEEVV